MTSTLQPAPHAKAPEQQHARPKRRWFLLGMAGPAVVVYAVFMLLPMTDSLWLSTLDASGAFVGLDNYRTLLADPAASTRFWSALRNNVVFFGFHLVFQNGIGLALAALLTIRGLRGGAVYRIALFTPTLLSAVIVGFIWSLMLNPVWNVRGVLLEPLGLGRFADSPLLNQSSTALQTISLVSVWQFTGIAMILFYAALSSIPESLEEAATLDGASQWQLFWRVKIPLIKPAIGLVTVLTFIGNFNAFDLVYTMKGIDAGPNFSTDILGTLFYRTSFGFMGPGDLIAGATLGGMMFTIIVMGALLYYVGWHTRVEVYDL